jgi:5-methylcytosine-specific restriction endonuclease McrA
MTSGYGYTRKAWQEARALALARARYRRRRCGSGKDLTVHDQDGRGPINGSNAQPDLLVLCRRCHSIDHAQANARSGRHRSPPTPD